MHGFFEVAGSMLDPERIRYLLENKLKRLDGAQGKVSFANIAKHQALSWQHYVSVPISPLDLVEESSHEVPTTFLVDT
jgi:hypothetical protein